MLDAKETWSFSLIGARDGTTEAFGVNVIVGAAVATKNSKI